jgi:hypothetical protein
MKDITCTDTIVLIGYSTGKTFINGVDLSTCSLVPDLVVLCILKMFQGVI